MTDEDRPSGVIERTLIVPNSRTIAGKYKLGRLIGEGGMGSVYEAEHLGLGMEVAVKMLADSFAEDQVFLTRFRREARAAAAVNHRNVVAVTDTGADEDGVPFLVMELLDGESLAAVLRRERFLPAESAADITCQILAGLAVAHGLGIIHRDLKPANIFLATDTDGRHVPKILDFGISKFASEVTAQVTAEGAVIGTPSYMAPEQVKGRSDVDYRIDLYAVGVILYRMVTGKLPFSGKKAKDIYERILTGDPTRPTMVKEEISPELEAVIMTAIAPKADDRYQSSAEFQLAIRDAVPNIEDTGPLPVFSRSSMPSSPGQRESGAAAHAATAADPTAQTHDARAISGLEPIRHRRRASDREPVLHTKSTPLHSLPPIPDTPSGGRVWLLGIVALVAAVAAGGLAFVGLQPPSASDVDANPADDAGAAMVLPPVAPDAGEGPPLIYAVARYSEAAAVREDHRALTEYLAQALGKRVNLVVTEPYDLASQLAQREVDIAALSAYRYVEAKNEVPGLRLIATAVNPGGSSYEGHILARADSGIGTLADFEGKVFCYVSESSSSGYIYPRAVFRRAGFDPDSLFRATRFTGDHAASLRMLESGVCDGVAVYQAIMHDASHGIAPQTFRVVATTARIPYDAYCLSESVDEDLALRIQEALLALEPDSEAAAEALEGSELRGFAPGNDRDYDAVREIVRFLDEAREH